MDYEGRLELSLAGEFEEDALRLQEVLNEAGVRYVMAGDEEHKQVLLVLPLDASDGLDAMQQLLEVWNLSWSGAFPGLAPPERSAMTAKPGVVEVPEYEDDGAAAPSDPDPGSDDEWADVDAELERDEANRV